RVLNSSSVLPSSLRIQRQSLMLVLLHCTFSSFFFNVTAPTEIYTLSLHDALPISMRIGNTSWLADERNARLQSLLISVASTDSKCLEQVLMISVGTLIASCSLSSSSG